jgi:hypothetical protein
MRARSNPCLLLVFLAVACNAPPEAPVVVINPSAPTTVDNLVVELSVPSTDPNAKDTVSYTYTWYQDGIQRVDISGYEVDADLTTKGESWMVEVTPSDGELEGELGSAAVVVSNSAPVATVEISPALPLATEDLTATPSGSDADGDTVTFGYTWTVDGVESAFAGDTVPASATSKGEVWEVTVVPNDGSDLGEPVSASVTIDNTPPRITSVSIGPDPAYEASTIEVLYEAEDDNGDAVTAKVTFYVDDLQVQDGAATTLTGEHFDKHQQVRAVLTPNDGYNDGNPVDTDTITVSNTPPSYAAATLDPSEIYEDTTVGCIPSGWSDDDGDLEGFRVEWYVEGASVGSGENLNGSLFDRGDDVHCEVVPQDGDDDGEPVASDAVTVGNTAPSIKTVTLSTTSPSAADTITVNVGGAHDPDGDTISYSYSWLVNGIAVTSGPSLSGTWFAKGDTVQVQVTPSDGSASGAPVLSAVATVVNSLPQVVSATISPTTAYTDTVLSATVSTSDADGDSITLTYAWTVDGAGAGGGTSLSGATAFDKGQVVALSVTPYDGTALGSTATAASVTVLNSPPTAPAVTVSPAEPIGGVDDLLCEVTSPSSDADGDTVTYAFHWRVDGADYTRGRTDTDTTSTVPGSETNEGEVWSCTVTPDDGEAEGSTGSASVGVGTDVCTYPDLGLTDSTGPVVGAAINPAYFTVDVIGTVVEEVVYDWANASGESPAYVQFEFYTSAGAELCSIYYDLDAATAVSTTAWATDSGEALHGAWIVPLSGGYTTCKAVNSSTWGFTDLRDVLQQFDWGFGVGDMSASYALELSTDVLDAGLDWTTDWEPYINGGYLWSDLFGQAYEMQYVWAWEHDCGLIVTDGLGDSVALPVNTGSPVSDGVYDVNSHVYWMSTTALQ